MRVYSVQNDVNRYQFVVAMRDEDATLLAALDGTPRAQSWRPPSVRIYQPQLKVGDFYQFLSAAFIMSERRAGPSSASRCRRGIAARCV